VNEELASQALESVRRHFQCHIGDGPAPELVRDYVSLHGYTTSWAVVWEEGPDLWAYGCPEGGCPDWPGGVWSEPTNHYVLALFGKES
jgi:hypothetical protein